MNNKSTENLIESGGSVEEIQALDVPPLKNHRKPKINPGENNPGTNIPQKKVSNNFLVGKSDEEGTELKPLNPPVPAARKFSLPPIASKRNVKDLKENSNQLTRKQSLRSDDTIQLVNERTVVSLRKSNKDRKTDSESDSPIQQNNSAARDKQNKIEMSLINTDVKVRLGRQFVVSQANEETTSFISYEEKHEKEDNSEHNNSSNHSSANIKNLSNDDNGGRNNEAFVPDDDLLTDEENRSKTDEHAEAKYKRKSKKREKKLKSTKKSKSKRLKSAVPGEEQRVVDNESMDERDPHETYDLKKVIGNKTVLLLICSIKNLKKKCIEIFSRRLHS